TTEALEDRVRRDSAVEHLALLIENCEPRVHRLHDVIGSGGKTVIRRVASCGDALRSFKACPESIEADDKLNRVMRAWRALLDGPAARSHSHHRRRGHRSIRP